MAETISILLKMAVLCTLYIVALGALASLFYEPSVEPDWQRQEGVSEVSYRASSGTVIINSSSDVFNYVYPHIGDSAIEHFVLLLLNRDNYVVGDVLCTDRICDSVRLPRIDDIARYCVENDVDSVIFAHNHPNGTRYPSSEDLYYTQGLAAKLYEKGIKLQDHVIVTREHYYSIRENNYCSAFG